MEIKVDPNNLNKERTTTLNSGWISFITDSHNKIMRGSLMISNLCQADFVGVKEG